MYRLEDLTSKGCQERAAVFGRDASPHLSGQELPHLKQSKTVFYTYVCSCKNCPLRVEVVRLEVNDSFVWARININEHDHTGNYLKEGLSYCHKFILDRAVEINRLILHDNQRSTAKNYLDHYCPLFKLNMKQV